MVVKEFYKAYEELCPMVVPRSANKLAEDDEFTLFAVTTFKKHSTEFIHKCREKRWTPREYKYKEGGKEEEAKEADQLAKDEKKLWGEALRLGRTGYSESAMIWIHVMALRVFVETVLRYGLPLDFVAGIVQVSNENYCECVVRVLTKTDGPQTSEEGEGKPRLGVLVPRRQRVRPRQQRSHQEGRPGYFDRHATSRPSGRSGIHCVRLLRVRGPIITSRAGGLVRRRGASWSPLLGDRHDL
jgi:hypothetical protein